MTPGARLQAAIELLDQIILAAGNNGAAADTLVARWFSTRRYAGSKDRAAVRELVYRAIRSFGEPPVSGRAAFAKLADEDETLAAAFDGSTYGPAALLPDEVRAEGGVMPGWLAKQIDPADHAALLDRAPLDVRANRLKTTPEVLAALWPEGSAIDGLPDALRFDTPFAIEKSDAWQDGLVEIQDAGSQWVVAACGAGPDMTAIDLCAGGGGKTLALAAALANAGRLVACDTDRDRLSNLEPRARRAGADVEVRLLDGGREAEGLWPILRGWPMSCSSMRRARAAGRCAAIPKRVGGCIRRGSTSWLRSKSRCLIWRYRWSSRAGQSSMRFVR